MSEKLRYKTEMAVRYRLYDSSVFLYHLRSHKVFEMSSICLDILDFLQKEHSFEELICALGKCFAVEDKAAFENDIRLFLDELIAKGIVSPTQESKPKKSNVIEKKLVSRCFEQRIPLNVGFELTYNCSERCRHCYAVGCEGQENRVELSTAQIKQVMDNLRQMGVFEITFTGGEVFVRKDALEILQYAQQKGFVVDIFTNGISISDEMIFQVAATFPRSIHFSLYSSKAETHDYITQVPGSFRKTLDVARKFIQLGVAVNIKTVVMNVNSTETKEMIALAEKTGATIQIGTSISAKNDCNDSPLGLRETELEKMATVFEHFYDRIDDCGYEDRRRDRESTVCGAGITSLSIDPYGDVYPCTALKIKVGNVLQSSIIDIWNNSIPLKEWYKNKFSMIEECRTCEKADFCAFCPGTAMQEVGSPLKRYDEACFITQAKLAALHKKYTKEVEP